MSRSERQEIIEWESQEMSIVQQAALLELNRSSLYYQPTPPSAEEVALKHRIDEISTETPMYGYRRITAQLHQEGRQVNPKTVARYMREMGLMAMYPGPNLSKRVYQAGIYPYLLRHITASYPNHIWGIDITYVRLRHGWVYLVAILDWFSRYVVSWELDQSLEISFVLEAVDRALADHCPLIWNSDQGSHFTSPRYVDKLKAHNIQISMDGKGRALDNIFTERLWRTIKYEEIYLKEYQTPREARRELATYLRWYNQQRLHQSLDYRTPASVYFSTNKERSSPLQASISLS